MANISVVAEARSKFEAKHAESLTPISNNVNDKRALESV
jgi:hypothetical protein